MFTQQTRERALLGGTRRRERVHTRAYLSHRTQRRHRPKHVFHVQGMAKTTARRAAFLATLRDDLGHEDRALARQGYSESVMGAFRKHPQAVRKQRSRYGAEAVPSGPSPAFQGLRVKFIFPELKPSRNTDS